MSDLTHTNLRRFIARLGRRMMLLRLLERVALATTVAALLACVLVLILWWRGANPLALSAVILGAGIVGGVVWAMVDRPTSLAIASEADRQLKLDDLLSSAVAVQESDAEWSTLIRNLADERCRTLSPGAVVARRLTGRAWGGIGLAWAMLLTLTLLAWEPHTGAARSWGKIGGNEVLTPSAPRDIADEAPMSANERAARNQANRKRVGQTDPSGNEASDRFGNDSTSAMEESQTADNPNDPGDAGSTAERRSSAGASESRSNDTSASIATEGTDRSEAANGAVAAGGAAGAARAPREGASPGVSSVQQAHGATVAPWQSADWAQHRERALSDVRSGTIDPAYRDLIRDYFER